MSSAAAAHFNSAEGDDARLSFPCPFCYVEIELPVFCAHLQEEHCFDLRNAICPLCAENLGKNPLEHFTLQHTQSIKKRLKSQKSGFWPSNQPGLGKELRDMSSYLASTSRNTKKHEKESAPDPLLSPFLFRTPLADVNHIKEDFRISSFIESDEKRITQLKAGEHREEDHGEKRLRAEFVEELVLSTIF